MASDGSIERAKNRAQGLLADAERDLAAGRISEAAWYARIDAVITPAYLQADNPRAPSGHSGDETHWRAGPLDLSGQPRRVDGDGDGNADMDMGAYELPK